MVDPLRNRPPDQGTADEACQILDAAKVAELRPLVIETRGLALLFKALADDTRVAIAYALSRSELCVCEVAALMGTSVATASHHLRLLRNMGLVRYRREGKQVFYALDDDHVLQLIVAAMDHFKEFPQEERK